MSPPEEYRSDYAQFLVCLAPNYGKKIQIITSTRMTNAYAQPVEAKDSQSESLEPESISPPALFNQGRV